jgi:hypothetical protein
MKFIVIILPLLLIFFSMAQAGTGFTNIQYGHLTVPEKVPAVISGLAPVAAEANQLMERPVSTYHGIASEDKTQPVSTRVYFRDLRKFKMNDTEAPEEIAELNGEQVTIIGYMVPFDSIENIGQFVLLQAPFMGCYHIPPPQPNESLMIFSPDQRIDYTYEPILITGTLEIEESYVEAYLVSRYTIHATTVRKADMQDTELDGLPADFHFGGDF